MTCSVNAGAGGRLLLRIALTSSAPRFAAVSRQTNRASSPRIAAKAISWSTRKSGLRRRFSAGTASGGSALASGASLTCGEPVARRDSCRSLTDDDRDLLMRGKHKPRRIVLVTLTVDVETDGTRQGRPVAAEPRGSEANTPDGEHLAERELLLGRRLDMDHTGCVVCVERRDE